MKNLVFVVFLLLSTQCFSKSLNDSVREIEAEWASIYYSSSKSQQGPAYAQLLDKTTSLARQYPNAAEPLFWQAVLKASYADLQDPFSALSAIHEARDLLIKAIKINPNTMDGSAYVTLGTLYYMVPKWPVSFGDDDTAKQMLEAALKINPDGIDANYFYGEFLLQHNRPNDAAIYLKKAATAPARAEQLYADSQLKEEARRALQNSRKRRAGEDKDMLLSVFNPASAN